MAEPIADVRRRPAENTAEQQAAAWLEKLVEHGDALHALLRLLQALQDHGVLPLLVGLAEQSGRVAEIVVGELNRGKNLRAVQNLTTVYGLAGQVDPTALKRIAEAVAAAVSADVPEEAGEKAEAPVSGRPAGAAQGRQPSRRLGWFGLLRQLRDPDVNRGLQFVLSLLRAIGRAQRTAAGAGEASAPAGVRFSPRTPPGPDGSA